MLSDENAAEPKPEIMKDVKETTNDVAQSLFRVEQNGRYSLFEKYILLFKHNSLETTYSK